MRIEIPGFSKQLSKAIDDSGMGIRALSRETGIPDSSISRYKNYNAYPDLGSLALLCEVLDVSADYLLFGKKK